MKKMIFVLLLPLSALSQEKIEGIYKFKPGLTTLNIIPELEKELRVKASDISDPETFYKKTLLAGDKVLFFNLININTLPDAKEYTFLSIPYSPVDTTHKVYYISLLKVAGIELKEIYLSFRKNILVKMICDKTEDIMNAMKAKYGEGETKIKTDTVLCTYKLTGNTVKETDTQITTTWENGNIQAYGNGHIYFDSKCKKQYSAFFCLEHNLLSNDFTKEDIAAGAKLKDKLNKANRQALKEKLSDF